MDINVSVIIPVYNSEAYIRRCIEVLLNQTVKECEFIFINDGSTDNTEKIINKYKNIDKRIKYCKQNNLGPSIARNQGINIAKGRYLMFIDSDDLISCSYIEKLLNEITENNYDIVCCGYIDESKYGILKLNDFWRGKNQLNKEEFIISVCSGVGGVLWGKIFKRDIIINNNIKMDSNIFMSEDLIFILDYCKYSSKFGVIEDYLYNYNRMNENSITSNINITYLENYSLVVNKIKDLLFFLNVEEAIINNIVIVKVQSIVSTILISESNKYLKLKDKEKFINNIKLVIEESFINDYTLNFTSNSSLDKIQNYFINRRKYLVLLYSNLMVIGLRWLKDKILRRA